MQNNLVIVESPAKAKTIGKFLGKDFKVMSSYGHIRDLKQKSFSIDTKTFQPEYEIPEDKKKVVAELQAASKKMSNVWLASDEDRKEKPFHGTWPKCWAWISTVQSGLFFMKSRKTRFWRPSNTPEIST